MWAGGFNAFSVGENIYRASPRVARSARNPGLSDGILSGFTWESTTLAQSAKSLSSLTACPPSRTAIGNKRAEFRIPIGGSTATVFAVRRTSATSELALMGFLFDHRDVSTLDGHYERSPSWIA